MSAITTHVLNTATGRPQANIAVRLERKTGGEFTEIARGTTDGDGRIRDLLPAGQPLEPGTYRMTFETRAVSELYPVVHVVFALNHPEPHYHIPLLISPYGYTTYRGS